MIKITTLVLLLLISAINSRDYPVFRQCDSKWANERIGTSSNTICQSGALISAVSMGLAGLGQNMNPHTLNTWLKAHKGYINQEELNWKALNALGGVTYEGKIPNLLVRMNIDVGYLVLINVKKGAHWALATSYKDSTIYVNDSKYTVASYDLNTDVVKDHTAIYKVVQSLNLPKRSFFVDKLNKMMNVKKSKNILQ